MLEHQTSHTSSDVGVLAHHCRSLWSEYNTTLKVRAQRSLQEVSHFIFAELFGLPRISYDELLSCYDRKPIGSDEKHMPHTGPLMDREVSASCTLNHVVPLILLLLLWKPLLIAASQ